MEAHSSVVNELGCRQAEILDLRLKHLYQDWKQHQERKEQARAAMESLYDEARLSDPRLPAPQKGLITAFHLARIIAETGPISDFSSWRKFLRFAGLNLRERQSGRYRGKTKISKKGRSKLRKVLGQVVLPLVKQSGLYGSYYHRKKTEERMPGTKAMVTVARHFLKMLYGCYQSGGNFDINRVFVCESQYRKAA